MSKPIEGLFNHLMTNRPDLVENITEPAFVLHRVAHEAGVCAEAVKDCRFCEVDKECEAYLAQHGILLH